MIIKYTSIYKLHSPSRYTLTPNNLTSVLPPKNPREIQDCSYAILHLKTLIIYALPADCFSQEFNLK